MQFPFGKYKGQDLDCTPTAYLKWFEENVECSIQLREAINAELKIRSSEETSIGRSVESPSYQSFEELLCTHLKTWLLTEHNAKRIILMQEYSETIQISLLRCLKNEVPRLMKLWRAQTK